MPLIVVTVLTSEALAVAAAWGVTVRGWAMVGHDANTAEPKLGKAFNNKRAARGLGAAPDKRVAKKGKLALDVGALVSWFEQYQRPLPWRLAGISPYEVWVSEMMLQQTQVDTVIPRYLEFLSRFPSLAALGRANQADVLAAWAGLRYYSRARNLHRAAAISLHKNGTLPDDAAGWHELPGIGRYTLGAVRSIAYGEPVALVDGNVFRVLTRWFGLRTSRGEPRTKSGFGFSPRH